MLAPSGSAHAPEALAFLLFVGSSVHVASTGWFYTVPEVRAYMSTRKARYVWWPLALISGAGAIALLVPATALKWLLLPYFGWQFFHYQKQNLGIAALAAASAAGRAVAHGRATGANRGGLAGVVALLARPSLLQVPVRPVLAAAVPGGGGRVRAFVAAGAGCLARRGAPNGRPDSACVPDVAAVRAAGVRLHLALRRGGRPDDRARPAVPAADGHGGGRRPRGAQRLAGLAALCNIALLGGAVLSIASDQAAEGQRRVLFGFFLGAVMAHFVVDAGLWRLRDEFPRVVPRLAAAVPDPRTRR